jgi:hypothetical protein
MGPLISGQFITVGAPRWNMLILRDYLVGAQGQQHHRYINTLR